MAIRNGSRGRVRPFNLFENSIPIRFFSGRAAVAFLALVLGAPGPAFGQDQCVGLPLVLDNEGWPEGTRVTVNIDSAFGHYVPAIASAVKCWENAGGSGVTFNIFSSPVPIKGRNTLQISREASDGDDGPAYTERIHDAYELKSAIIRIHPDYEPSMAHMAVVAGHEVGHTFGFHTNCHPDVCTPGTTAMANTPVPGSWRDGFVPLALKCPTACDHAAINEGMGYSGTPPGGTGLPTVPANGPDPEACHVCGGVHICLVTQICLGWPNDPNFPLNTCFPVILGCFKVERWCCPDALGVQGSQSVCGTWEKQEECEPNTTCCIEPVPQITCRSYGLFDADDAAACEAEFGQPCEQFSIVNQDCGAGNPCVEAYCLGEPLTSCGSMGGDYCSQTGVCPDDHTSLGLSNDCAACCRQTDSTCVPTGCAAGTCGWQTDNCGEQIYCGECGPSCGEMGGDYCSQTGSCPSGYTSLGPSYECGPCCQSLPSCGTMGGDYCSQNNNCPSGFSSLGASFDCATCCETIPCVSTGCQAGTCGMQTDNCGNEIFCGECGPSCGEMGGDHCSATGSCPNGFAALGASYDCSQCCQTLPSCGVMGGDYCSTSASCPSGYNSLGPSGDCATCCKTKPCQSTGCPAGSCGWRTDNCGKSIFCGQCAPTCGAMGGDYCSQNNSCPGGYSSLGQSSDCKRCCKANPSCGAMGGNYCSQTGSCPAGYTSLGQSNDCRPCCVAN